MRQQFVSVTTPGPVARDCPAGRPREAPTRASRCLGGSTAPSVSSSMACTFVVGRRRRVLQVIQALIDQRGIETR